MLDGFYIGHTGWWTVVKCFSLRRWKCQCGVAVHLYDSIKDEHRDAGETPYRQLLDDEEKIMDFDGWYEELQIMARKHLINIQALRAAC